MNMEYLYIKYKYYISIIYKYIVIYMLMSAHIY